MNLALVQKLTALWSSWTHWTERNWLLDCWSLLCVDCVHLLPNVNIVLAPFNVQTRATRRIKRMRGKQEWKRRRSCLSHSVEISQLLSIHQSTNTYLYDAKSQANASQSCLYNQRKTHWAISAHEVQQWLEKKKLQQKKLPFFVGRSQELIQTPGGAYLPMTSLG